MCGEHLLHVAELIAYINNVIYFDPNPCAGFIPNNTPENIMQYLTNFQYIFIDLY